MEQQLKILIGCEESQEVGKAFRAAGHLAYSNDFKECSGGYPEWHLQMCVLEAIDLMDWDFIGLHPDCRKLSLTGNRTYAPGKPKHHERLDVIEWTSKLWIKATKKAKSVYLENPIGVLNTDFRMPKPQIIHPYYFGDPFQKSTCLWLKGLPKLIHSSVDDLYQSKSHVSPGEFYYAPSGVRMPKWLANTPTSGGNEKNRAIRSKTFPGIAKAMAEQWGAYLLRQKQISNAA